MIFTPGLNVRYREISGYVNFVSDQYITICIDQITPDPLRAVCVLVYHEQWDQVHLEKQSEK